MTRAEASREKLRQALNAERRAAGAAVRNSIHHERADKSTGVGDLLEQTDTNSQSDLEFALVQMRAETLARVNEALARLDAGQHESCIDCKNEIAESRRRALPFAIRCRTCAERHEQRSHTSRASTATDPERPSPFATIVGP